MTMTTEPAGPAGIKSLDVESIAVDVEDALGQAESLTPVTELTKFLDPLRIPPRITVPAHEHHKTVKISMRRAKVKLHSQLPSTTVWAYNGSFPGPTIEARSGETARIDWNNEIDGLYPVVAVELPVDKGTAGPGRDGAEPMEDVAALPPWTVVHLHGARTNARNDGWTENAGLPGTSQPSEYPNEQRATGLWYHDHASGITARNVMAGLLGMYLIRDDEEDALGLPDGDHEVPLILCDRNLDTDAQGNLTSQMLYKQLVLPGDIKLPFSGPFTLVNGVIWPHLEVDARWYRFRVLNASNSRFYGLALQDEDGKPVTGALHLIGTDGGLLPKPVALDGLTLAPSERADVLIDFSAYRGKSLVLANTLPVFVPGPTDQNPDVMQFRVDHHHAHDHFKLPATLSPSFVRLTHHDLPADHVHRWVMLTLVTGKHPEMWEMDEIDELPPPGTAIDGVVQVKLSDGTLKTFKRASRSFRDAANFYVDHDGWEIWNILNLSGVTHPIHLHLVEFQTIGLGRQRFDIHGFSNDDGGTKSPVTFVEGLPLEAADEGWKDTIRVGRADGGELVTVAARFGGGTGRYMYHCHILEHEDEGMMSTFIVIPKEVMAVDPMHGPGHGGGHSHGMKGVHDE
jgi:o-aminophenol oxidase